MWSIWNFRNRVAAKPTLKHNHISSTRALNRMGRNLPQIPNAEKAKEPHESSLLGEIYPEPMEIEHRRRLEREIEKWRY